MKIQTSEIRAIVETLCQYLEETKRHEIETEQDYYWQIPRSDLYDPTKDPTDFTLGQLTDDWSELQRIAKDTSPPIGFAFVWLSSILRIIGEENVH